MRALFLSLVAGLCVQASAGPQDLQWPSGEGVCSGSISFKQYKACDQVTVAKAAVDDIKGCNIQSQEEVSDASCGKVDQQAKCEKPTGEFKPAVASEYTLRSCDGACDDNFCRGTGLAKKQSEFPGHKVEFVSGRPGDKTSTNELHDGRWGRKTQICTYNVSAPIMGTVACTVSVPEKCKVKVTFAKSCQTSACGIDEKQKVTKYGDSMQSLEAKAGTTLVPNSAFCTSCDGWPELPTGQMTPDWADKKAKCLINQYGAFKQYESNSYAKAAMGKMEASIKALLEAGEGKLSSDNEQALIKIVQPGPQ